MIEKFFNTAGPVKPDMHYTINPLHRIDVEEIEMLIRQQKYFVLHAPRQTGKTSCLLALRNHLNAQQQYWTVYANVEAGQAMRENIKEVVHIVSEVIANETALMTGTDLSIRLLAEVLPVASAGNLLTTYLSRLCAALDRPLILFLDEIDSLVGDSLVSVLRQIRSGYTNRPQNFPQTIILCGVRDVRDYRIVTSNKDIVTGGSAFNIKAESLRLGNFNCEEIRELYLQHTAATGQEFDPECFPMIWNATEGQPWLVNALGYEVTEKMRENRDRTIRIIPEMIYRAQERIIYRRDTHIDILIDKLREDRVRRVIEPMLSGEEGEAEENLRDDDIQYVADMGLVVRDKPLRISNAIYREIIPRELTWTRQQTLVQQSAWYIRPDGSIDVEKLLLDFQQFFRQNADSWIERFDYKESGPQLLLQAFLQRVVNGGGYIDREYGLGRGRTDLLIRKPLTDDYGGPMQRIVMELKIKRNSLERTIADGLRQTAEYLDRCAPDAEAHFILFNRDKGASWDEKLWHRTEHYGQYRITVWGM